MAPNSRIPPDKLTSSRPACRLSQGINAVITVRSAGAAINTTFGNRIDTRAETSSLRMKSWSRIKKRFCPLFQARRPDRSRRDTTLESVQLTSTQGSFAASNPRCTSTASDGTAIRRKTQDALQSFLCRKLDLNFARACAAWQPQLEIWDSYRTPRSTPNWPWHMWTA
jgi:hypothetical protein